MIQVLLVDDDASLLEDLRGLLFMQGAAWSITTARSGAQALSYLENGVFDVVVTDLKMPEMDGAELLSLVRELYPQAMRILMSGNTDVTYTAQLVPQAHQFLLKPLDVRSMIGVVERAYEVGQRLSDPELRNMLGRITELPRPTASVLKLNSLLDDSDASINEVSDVVEQDMALTVRLFQLVNSAYYGLHRNITDVREAIAYLGMNTVRNLAVSIEMFRSVSATATQHADVVAELHEHGSAVAQLARQLVLGRDQANEAFIAGLLHDVGLLALATYMPDRFSELREAAHKSSLPVWDLEIDVIGANHSDLGAYLLDLWGLPFPVVEAVARHHDAPMLSDRKMDPTHAVCVASAIVSAQRSTSKLLPYGETIAIETSYMKELGVLERVAGLVAVGSI
jgi:HD-like signal output (HDOD) protein